MHNINLHQLATFQVVAKHCSYVRAAEELHFSQPAVSAQIHQLEESLGVKLFDKIGRKTHLTQAGEELYLYSQKIFALIDETLDTMSALASPHSGRLSVGADTTVGTYVIPNLLGKFRQIPILKSRLRLRSSTQHHCWKSCVTIVSTWRL